VVYVVWRKHQTRFTAEPRPKLFSLPIVQTTLKMAGGLMQLVAYGSQDIYLTANPKVTFFQAVYKRHSNFASEVIEQTVNGNPADNGRVSITIARNGDLVQDMYLEMKAKSGLSSSSKGASAIYAAERAIKDIEVSIGGQRIDRHFQKWWRLFDNLYHTEAKKADYAKMTSNTQNGAIYLPLIFWFNRHPGLSLPLIALQYHECRVDVDLSSEFSHYTDGNTLKCWANYHFLDTEERRRFAQKSHEYLIEQVQHTGTDSVSATSTKQVRLSFNHPVKELLFAFGNGSVSNASLWNFTSNLAETAVVLESDVHALGATSNIFVPVTYATGAPLLAVGQGYSESTVCEDGAVAATRAVGPLSEFKVILNGQDRMKAQSGKYFNQVQPYTYHAGSPVPGVYSYSFALKPEEHQPSGTCNFSRIDNAQVSVTLKSGATQSETMHLFATNYNVLRVQSGMGGLAFSN